MRKTGEKHANPTDSHKKVIETLNQHLNKETEQRGTAGKLALDAFKDSQLQYVLNASPSVVLIYNFVKGKYEFVTKNVTSLLGCSAEELMSDDGYAFAFTRFNPIHAEVFASRVTPVSMEYLMQYARLHRVKDLKMSFTIQSKNKSNEYLWTLMQINILETDEDGLPLLSIQFLTDIQDIKKDDPLYFSILLKDTEQQYHNIFKETYLSSHINDFLLSTRELEILTLAGQGITAQEIADKLFISKHTVHTHKQNILKKTACSNITEALRILTIRGLI